MHWAEILLYKQLSNTGALCKQTGKIHILLDKPVDLSAWRSEFSVCPVKVSLKQCIKFWSLKLYVLFNIDTY